MGDEYNLGDFMAAAALKMSEYDQMVLIKDYMRAGFDFNRIIPLGYECSSQALLHWAVSRGDKSLVKLLVENGANINALDKFHATCLFDAWNNLSMTQLLLELGVDTTIQAIYPDFTGTILQWCRHWYCGREDRRKNCEMCLQTEKRGMGEFCEICKIHNLDEMLVIESLMRHETRLPDAKPAGRRK